MAGLAVSAAAAQYAGYPAYARQFARMGLGRAGRAAAALVRAVRRDDLGSPAGDWRSGRGLEEYRSAGADLVVVYPVPARGATEPRRERRSPRSGVGTNGWQTAARVETGFRTLHTVTRYHAVAKIPVHTVETGEKGNRR